MEKASRKPPECTDVSHIEIEQVVTELGSYSLYMQLFFWFPHKFSISHWFLLGTKKFWKIFLDIKKWKKMCLTLLPEVQIWHF